MARIEYFTRKGTGNEVCAALKGLASLCEWNLNRIWVSFEESVSLTLVLLLDVLDLHQHDSLGSAHNDHSPGLANGALQSERDFLGGLGLLPEDGLGLASVAGLFAVVASPALRGLALLALLVLRDLVDGVGEALAAVGLAGLGNHNHL